MKKTLLIAAAALVAGVVSSQAQVYSANIVGYVNAVCPAGTLVLLANPLDDGTNKANDVLASLPNKSSVQLWNGTGFTSYPKSAAGFTGNPSLPVGSGFFVNSASNFTNTFVGNVVPNPGGNTATNTLPAGTLTLVGSILPVSGNFNDAGTNAFNLTASLPNKSSVQLWNGSGFTSYPKSAAGFTGNPAYNPGLGFFVNAASAANWVQTLK